MKNIVLLLMVIINCSLFSMSDEEYANKYFDAKNLLNEKYYKESQNIYVKLLEEKIDYEVALEYIDCVGRGGEYVKAISILDKYYIQLPEEIKLRYLLEKAKLYGWNKDYKKAFEIYKDIINDKNELDEYGEVFMDWYNQYRKFEFKFYFSGDTQTPVNIYKEGNKTLSLSYNGLNKYKITLYGGSIYKNEKYSNILASEVYIGSYYISGGNGDISRYGYITRYDDVAKYFIAFGKTYGIFTFGIKYNSYDNDKDTLSYKIQADNILLGLNFTNRINFIHTFRKAETKVNFAVQMELLNVRAATYFDVDRISNSILTMKFNNIGEILSLETGIYRDYENQTNGVSLVTGVKF